MSESLTWPTTWPHAEHSRFVEAANIKWHVQTMGDGPDLLLIHGTGASTHSWRDAMPLLAKDFKVHAIDLPGHGFSSLPNPQGRSLNGMVSGIAELLRILNVKPEIVAGHSAGSAILVRLCSMNHIAPQNLVSFNGAFFPIAGLTGAVFSPIAKTFAALPFLPNLFARMADAKAVARLMADTGSRLSPEGLAIYQRLFRSPTHIEATLGMMAAWDLSDMAQDLSRLIPCATFVAAQNDRTVPPPSQHKAASLCPQAQVVTVANYGHLMHEEDPKQAADIIRNTSL
jgi:magnesium chelatase accessory protein